MSAGAPNSQTPQLAKDAAVAEEHVATSNEGSHHEINDEKLGYQASDRDIESHNGRPPVEAIEPHPQGEPGRASKLWHSIRTHKATRIAFDFALIGLILGWWLPGIIREETRHRWVITTIWSWFFILLILFHNDRYIPKAPFANAIGAAWTTGVSRPWGMVPHYGQIGLGWLALLALYFGSAFGIKEVPESRYGDRARSLFGVFLINSFFYCISTRRAAIKLQPVMTGLGLQMIIGLLVFKTGAFFSVARWLAFAAADLLAQGQLGGAAFFWGDLAGQHYFFIDTLSSIIFFVALVVLLSYLGVMSWAIRKFAWFFFKLMGISGAEAVVAAASPFIGQGENAVLVQSFLDLMTNAEIFQVLTSGFSTIAGSVFLAYVQMGVSPTHLITAAVMSIPASIAASKMVVPETETPVTAGSVNIQLNEKADAVDPLHAFSNGAWLGVRAGTPVAVELPCGMAVGSRVTVVARPRRRMDGASSSASSQFMVELLGTKAVQGEEPPRILHFNPRLAGDFSGRPVIELNTCYRMQWALPQRCDGSASRPDHDTVDGEIKCEKWIRDDGAKSEESTTNMKWLLNSLIGRPEPEKVSVDQDQAYPFAEGKLFALTITAGLEGYHVNVDGRHVASFPYRTGYNLEDATGLSLNGDLDIESVSANHLPKSHPSFDPQRYLEMSEQWKASPLPTEPVELFIGILSSANHFAERMAVRKSWMIATRRSSNSVARFFVALNGKKEVNEELKKEAEFFGDIVLVPFMDSYDLVVLKTIAIAEYGVRVVQAKYVMKCDDDTFVRIDAVLDQVKKVKNGASMYVGNINYYHRPLRSGKWAVTYEEWEEEVYPPYANGPGYVISSDIAEYIVSEFDNQKLRLFKMEDVSMGMWVQKFSKTRQPVEYSHDVKFFQAGCFDGYYTAHYQSPQHMICLWRKLQSGSAQCCNAR